MRATEITFVSVTVGLLMPQATASDFSKQIAYGPFSPWNCEDVSFHPTTRIISAMSMLLFPILFYAVYQCCCVGETFYTRCCNPKPADSENKPIAPAELPTSDVEIINDFEFDSRSGSV